MSWVWLVDPGLRLVEVFEAVGGFATLKHTATNQDRLVLPPFAHELDVTRWWG